MVTTHCAASSPDCQFEITPNSSLSWRETVIFFCGISTVSMTIAVSLAMQGLWLVVPFSGLELIALGGALYYVGLRNQSREIVALTGETIYIRFENRIGKRIRDHRLQRAWARVDLRRSTHRGHPQQLLICSHGQEIEIGQILTDDERRYLARELDRRLQENPAAQGAG